MFNDVKKKFISLNDWTDHFQFLRNFLKEISQKNFSKKTVRFEILRIFT